MEKKTVKAMIEMVSFDGVSFVSIRGYKSKETGEIADYLLNFGVSYMGCLTSDLATLRAPEVMTAYAPMVKEYGVELVTEAVKEMVTSREKSLVGENDRAKANYDSRIAINDNTDLFLADNTLGFHGMLVKKTVIVPGEYKAVKSRPKTLIKKALEKELRGPQYRRFKLDGIRQMKTGGDTITVELEN